MTKSNLASFVIVVTTLVLAGCSQSSEHQRMYGTTNKIRQISLIMKAANHEERIRLVNALKAKNATAIKAIAETYGISDLYKLGFVDCWMDGWGSEFLVTPSNDYSLILLCSFGPNRKFDKYLGDDIVFVFDFTSGKYCGPN